MTNLNKYHGSTVAIMQPYFFPYLGYFSLIQHTDYWIVFDPVQYIRKGWMNRNRILAPENPNGGWQYISVSLQKATRNTLIKNIQVNNNLLWQDKLLRQLEHYRKKAPFFDDVHSLLLDTFKADINSIVNLNAHLLNSVCDYLSIPFDCEFYSVMDFPEFPITHAGDWALNICKHLHVSKYVNPLGGKALFNEFDWKANDIELNFLSSNLPYYSQRRKESIMGLSIIDTMMFNSIDTISDMLYDIDFH